MEDIEREVEELNLHDKGTSSSKVNVTCSFYEGSNCEKLFSVPLKVDKTWTVEMLESKVHHALIEKESELANFQLNLTIRQHDKHGPVMYSPSGNYTEHMNHMKNLVSMYDLQEGNTLDVHWGHGVIYFDQ
jgi:hypothetical protein